MGKPDPIRRAPPLEPGTAPPMGLVAATGSCYIPAASLFRSAVRRHRYPSPRSGGGTAGGFTRGSAPPTAPNKSAVVHATSPPADCAVSDTSFGAAGRPTRTIGCAVFDRDRLRRAGQPRARALPARRAPRPRATARRRAARYHGHVLRGDQGLVLARHARLLLMTVGPVGLPSRSHSATVGEVETGRVLRRRETRPVHACGRAGELTGCCSRPVTVVGFPIPRSAGEGTPTNSDFGRARW